LNAAERSATATDWDRQRPAPRARRAPASPFQRIVVAPWPHRTPQFRAGDLGADRVDGAIAFASDREAAIIPEEGTPFDGCEVRQPVLQAQPIVAR